MLQVLLYHNWPGSRSAVENRLAQTQNEAFTSEKNANLNHFQLSAPRRRGGREPTSAPGSKGRKHTSKTETITRGAGIGCHRGEKMHSSTGKMLTHRLLNCNKEMPLVFLHLNSWYFASQHTFWKAAEIFSEAHQGTRYGWQPETRLFCKKHTRDLHRAKLTPKPFGEHCLH